MQTPTTIPFVVFSNLQDRTDAQEYSATLAILPDASPFLPASGADALPKGRESTFYAKLGSEDVDWRASGIVHDFNNQLAIILSHCSIALNKIPADSTARQNLERAIRATKRAADLSTQLQVVTEEGIEEIGAVNLNELIRDTVETVEPRLRTKAEVELNLARNLPPVPVNPSLIARAVMNLLINAADALPASGGQIRIATETITAPPQPRQTAPQSLPPGTYVAFQVSDSGSGMTQETLNQIFEPYFTTKGPGMGLGLTAALRIVQAHRGSVFVWSTPGQGSIFRILLPVPSPAG